MKRHAIFLSILASALCVTSCHRSSCEVWEDTKTCSRYLDKGLRSLLGHHIDSRDYANYYKGWEEQEESTASKNSEFIPLADNEHYQSLETQEFRLSKESPGDPGSLVPGIDRFIQPIGTLAAVFNNVQFETDVYSIQGSENLKTLRNIANYLSNHPQTYVFVEGHADERGSASYNLALGAKRANSVRNFLIQQGASPDQLFTISYGLERPLAQGHDALAMQKNRRAQFKLYER